MSHLTPVKTKLNNTAILKVALQSMGLTIAGEKENSQREHFYVHHPKLRTVYFTCPAYGDCTFSYDIDYSFHHQEFMNQLVGHYAQAMVRSLAAEMGEAIITENWSDDRMTQTIVIENRTPALTQAIY